MGFSGFIQAGGRSSRMGTDKAWLRFGDQYTIELVIAALQPAVAQLAIVANSDRYKELGLPVYPDIISDYGPLGGIHTALSNSENDGVFIVSCDLPFVTSDFFRFLADHRDGYQIVVPLDQHERTQQMCALYSKSCLPIIETVISENERRPRMLFDRCRTKYVSWEEISHLTNSNHFFDNLNTPEDYKRALDLMWRIRPDCAGS
ncbi:MAG TPA: molybdenum cofactor guanylyltransferase [Blastocatellia bacterium]|nr:molybdenum cofactor guanylyltransferase [Blastocatellia bacterium]